MADDFVVNVRQLAQYPQITATQQTDRYLLQQGGVGGPYASIDPVALVSSALEMGGWLRLAPHNGLAWNGASLTSDGQTIRVPGLRSDGDIFVAGNAVATRAELFAAFDEIRTNSVFSFNGRKGVVILEETDILRAGGIAANNPHFTGLVLAPTIWDFRDSTDKVATTAFVQGVLAALLCSGSVVTSFNGRGGDVIPTAGDVSTALGVPGVYATVNTAPLGDASRRIANTLFVDNAIEDLRQWVDDTFESKNDAALGLFAPIDSPHFTGIPTAPTAATGTNSGQLATTAFVAAAVATATTGVSSWNTRTGNVSLLLSDVTTVGGAPIASPTFTGTPAAPTPSVGNVSTQIATCAFVANQIAASTVTSFNARHGTVTLLAGDITGAGGALTASPALTGSPTAPTAAGGTNTTQIATTAFVQNAVAAATAGVASFNGRTGIVTLLPSDISAATGALLASPSFTGVPTGPTAAPGTSTSQLATTAFVTTATGVPEAPTDSLAYGRRNAAWVQVIMATGDIIDGGNF